MGNFEIGDYVKVMDCADIYYGYYGTIMRCTSYSFNAVPIYEIKFMEPNKYAFPNECRLGHYLENMLVKVSRYEYDREVLDKKKVKRESSSIDAFSKYIRYDVFATKELLEKKTNSHLKPHHYDNIKRVIFNPPYTILIMKDGRKAIVKCGDGETYDPEKGLAMALCKIGLGSNKNMSNYYEIFEKWLPKKPETEVNIVAVSEKPVLEPNCAAMMFNFGNDHNNVQKIIDLMPEELKNQIFDILVKQRESNVTESESDDPSNPCNTCTKKQKSCWVNCEALQTYCDSLDEEKKPEPIEPGYFLEKHKRREKPVVGTPKKPETTPMTGAGGISQYVAINKYYASYFAKDFVQFCKDNDLYFYIVDTLKGGMKKINPYDEKMASPEKINYYLKRGFLESCKKTRKSGKSYPAVDMNKALFSRLPIEERRGNRKEDKEIKEGGEE